MHRDNPLSRIICAPIDPLVTVCYTMKIWLLFCFSGNFFFHPYRAKWRRGMKKRIRERVTKAKGAWLSRMMRLGNLWVTRLRPLETWAENFPCHQYIPVSNLYAKTSEGTWRIDGSQIWTRTGRDSILCRVCWTHSQKFSFCDNKNFPSSWKDDPLGYLSMDLNIFYVYPTQGELKDLDGKVKHRSDLDELLGMSTTSMDFDVASVEGETQLQVYMQVEQVPNDTDPLMWWK